MFVDGFTQTRRRRGASRVLPTTLRRRSSARPSPTTFVDAAFGIGWQTSYLEQERRLERTAYVGYSQGGRLCLQLALDRPEVVSSARARERVAGHRRRRRTRGATRRPTSALAQEIERDGVDAFLERWLAQPLFATLPRERAGLDDRRPRNTVERLTHQLRVLGQGVAAVELGAARRARGCRCCWSPASATRSTSTSRSAMADAIPHARVEIVPDAGHACHLEQPEHVAQLLPRLVGERAS